MTVKSMLALQLWHSFTYIWFFHKAEKGMSYVITADFALLHYYFRLSLNFSSRSSLPVGAGLGSSAAFSACAATALLLFSRRINLPPLPAPTSSSTGHIHVSHQGRRALPPKVAEEVNRWAFVAEKILHGNPSGVDNSVAVFGGALAYTRAGFERKSGMEPIQGQVPTGFSAPGSRS